MSSVNFAIRDFCPDLLPPDTCADDTLRRRASRQGLWRWHQGQGGMRIVSGTFSVSHRPVGQVIFARRLARTYAVSGKSPMHSSTWISPDTSAYWKSAKSMSAQLAALRPLSCGASCRCFSPDSLRPEEDSYPDSGDDGSGDDDLGTARSLYGSSSAGITDRTIVRPVERNPMMASVVATGRPPGTRIGVGRGGNCQCGVVEHLRSCPF